MPKQTFDNYLKGKWVLTAEIKLSFLYNVNKEIKTLHSKGWMDK
jgi:hypothetical protein